MKASRRHGTWGQRDPAQRRDLSGGCGEGEGEAPVADEQARGPWTELPEARRNARPDARRQGDATGALGGVDRRGGGGGMCLTPGPPPVTGLAGLQTRRMERRSPRPRRALGCAACLYDLRLEGEVCKGGCGAVQGGGVSSEAAKKASQRQV